MAGFANFFRYDTELVAVYCRFGTKPFQYQDVADIFPKTMLARFRNTGYLLIHESRLKGRTKAHLWRLNPQVVPQCKQALLKAAGGA